MEMVTVKRKNKILDISELRLESYLKQGYDQIDKEGNVVARATGGRSVSLPEYNKVLEELDIANEKIDAANKIIEELESRDHEVELAEAKREIKSLKTENTKLKNAAGKTDGGE